MIEPGTILQNRYRIEKHIGQGGMGKVYVALDERFNSTVAIKETVFEDKTLRKAFEREARLLNSLKHQALPRVSDHFIEDDGQYLVMEFIAGEDLAEMMERDGKAFPLEDVLNWANQLCDALDYLHLQDIIHRDIKPQNLKLTPKGQIVLLDFGLAKGNAMDAPNQTQAKSIFGYSRSYASLEQIQGTGTEPRSDLYSLAATLYHLLTGIPPVDALTRAMNVLNGQPDPLIPANLINNKVPRAVAGILQKTMALNANERPIDARSLQRMLDECDKEIDEEDSNSAIAPLFTADLLTQETKLKSATTNVPVKSQSQIETKIQRKGNSNPNGYETRVDSNIQESKVTRVRPVGEKQKNSRKAAVAGAALVLLAGAASAFYLYSPASLTQRDANPAGKNNGSADTFVITPPVNQSFANANSPLEQTVLTVSETNMNADSTLKSPEKSVAAKTASIPKNPVKEQKNQSVLIKNKGKTSVGEITGDNVVVRGETIETKDMIINEDGITWKNPAKKPPFNKGIVPPVTPPTEFKNLTPERLRKLEQFRRINPRIYTIKPPLQHPTPKP